MKTYYVKHILESVKSLIEYKLKTTETTNISKIVCYDILSLVDVSEKEIPLSKFKAVIGRHLNVITNHINWLIDNNILWRSKLSIDIKNSISSSKHINETYKYSLRNDMIKSLDNYNLFIYDVVNSIVKPELEIESEYQPMVKAFLNLEVDIKKATKELFESKKSNKLDQARAFYSINLNDFHIRKGQNVDRIYSNITSISSDFHEFLYLNGKQVSEIDANQCQLTIMSMLTSDVESEFHSIVKMGSFYNWLLAKLVKLGYSSIITTNEYGGKYLTRVDTTMYHFEKRFEEGKIYYKNVKGWVYAAIFSGFTNGTTVSKILKEHFQPIVNRLNELKGELTLAAFLQNIEAKIWVKASLNLNKKGVLNISKHDSLLFKASDYDAVYAELEKEYAELNPKYTEYNLFHSDLRYGEKQFNSEIIVVTKLEDDFDAVNSKHKSLVQSVAQKVAQRVNADTTEYEFNNSKTGETFKGIKIDFASKYGLDKKEVNKVIRGIKKSVKGWKLS